MARFVLWRSCQVAYHVIEAIGGQPYNNLSEIGQSVFVESLFSRPRSPRDNPHTQTSEYVIAAALLQRPLALLVQILGLQRVFFIAVGRPFSNAFDDLLMTHELEGVNPLPHSGTDGRTPAQRDDLASITWS